MSRSQPTLTNPAKRFMKWSGSKGTLSYYDKENQTEVEVKLPFTFLVLDQLATITGYSDQDESSYWSNEVRSVAKEQLTVKTSKGIKEVGLYKDLMERSKGAKYAKSVYVAYDTGTDEGYVIGNLKLFGAALTAWIEFSKRCANVELGKISLTGSEEAKKGTTVYRTPTFEWAASGADEDSIALELDKELQVYLSQYLNPRPNLFDRIEEPQDDWVPDEAELNATLND